MKKACIGFLEYAMKDVRHRRPRLGFEPRHPAFSLVLLHVSPQAGRLTATSPRPLCFSLSFFYKHYFRVYQYFVLVCRDGGRYAEVHSVMVGGVD